MRLSNKLVLIAVGIFCFACSGGSNEMGVGTVKALDQAHVLGASNLTEQAVTPLISFDADPVSVDRDASSLLSWATTNAEQCFAEGAWSGEVGSAGTFRTDRLSAHTEFILRCVGRHGAAQRSVVVKVAGETNAPALIEPQRTLTLGELDDAQPTPTVSLNSIADVVESGADITLEWKTTDADSCKASGGWSGFKSVSGAQMISKLKKDQTFTLICQGPGGSAVAMVSIKVRTKTPVSWGRASDNLAGNSMDAIHSRRSRS